MATREVTLVIADDSSYDPELLEASVLSLREEILTIAGIQDLMPQSVVTPARSKGGADGLVGTLVIAVPASIPVLRELRMLLRDWLHRNDGKKVRLEIGGTILDATGLSDDALEKLVIRGVSPDASQ